MLLLASTRPRSGATPSCGCPLAPRVVPAGTACLPITATPQAPVQVHPPVGLHNTTTTPPQMRSVAALARRTVAAVRQQPNSAYPRALTAGAALSTRATTPPPPPPLLLLARTRAR